MLRWKSYTAQGDRPGRPLTADFEIQLPDWPDAVSFSPALENTGHNGDCPDKNSEGPANRDSALLSQNPTAKLREPLDDECSGLIHKQAALPLPEQQAKLDQSLRITFDSTLQGHRRDSVTIYNPPLGGRDRSKTHQLISYFIGLRIILGRMFVPHHPRRPARLHGIYRG